MDIENKESDSEKEQIEEKEQKFEINPIKVPQYLIDIANYVKKQKIPNSYDLSETNIWDSIIYGISCEIKIKEKKFIQCIVFQSLPEPQILSVAVPKTMELRHIDITKITHVELEKREKPILMFNLNSLSITFAFLKIEDMFILLKALLLLFEKYIFKDENLNTNKILKLWQKYDTDCNNKLDFNEFTQFFNDLGLANLSFIPSTKEEMFRAIDVNIDGIIDYQEFLNFYLFFTNGAEYQELFLKYSSDFLFLNPRELQTLILKEQKERYTLEKCGIIILATKQNLTKMQKVALSNKINNQVALTKEEIDLLKMTLEEFKLYLTSNKYNNALKIKDEEDIDLSHPLYDYYINSTHNTYLAGNQLMGQSNSEMYGIALVNGYKFLEIDCYNEDSTGDIVITHGWTMVSKIHLNDVLKEIKAKAFDVSWYPVIISVENHMNEKNQEIFVNKCKEILGNLYIIDQKYPPLDYPTLSDLKEKFIIELGGKRIFSTKNEDNEMDFSSTKKENKQLKMMEDNITSSPPKSLKRKNKMDIANEEMNIQPKKMQKQEITKTINCLDAIRGLYKVKFQINEIKEMNYQPWEISSMKCTKISNFSSYEESRIKLINFTKKGFIKSYPINYDSSNYDLVKIWMSGCQVASINIQSFDDWTLLNKIFFKTEGGIGYALKPKKFWHRKRPSFEKYDLPYGTVTFEILTTSGLDNVINHEKIVVTENYQMIIEVYIVGSYMDDKMNIIHSLKMSGNFILPKIENKKIIFNVYEKDLAFFYFKVKFNNNVIARSVVPLCALKEGIRNIALYDNKCVEYKDSVMMLMIEKDISHYKIKYH